MTTYQVGSVADLVSNKAPETSAKPATKGLRAALQKNPAILQQLFAVSNAEPATVQNVPIASTKKAAKKKKRTADEYKIISVAKGKKIKLENEDSANDEEIEKILDLPDENVEAEDEIQAKSASVSRSLKKKELANIKKNAEKKDVDEKDKDRVVIVKNLPIKVKRKSVGNLFIDCGKVDAVWLRCAALPDQAMPKKVAIIKQDFHPERQSITAFVRFATPEAAQKAAAMTGMLFQDHHLAISSISESAKKELSKGVFVGNLAFGVEDEALWRHFKCCGVIKDVRVVRDPNNGMGKGFGYVNFESADSVELAIKLNGSTMAGDREIRVERCKNKPKKASNFGERLNAKDPKEPRAKRAQRSGAVHRIEKKLKKKRAQGEKEDDHDDDAQPKKDAGWIKTMRQRQKKTRAGAGVHSFSGETTGGSAEADKPQRKGKLIKKTKEERRRQSIAAKLTAV